MEFGAMKCKPKDPNCLTCCLNKSCKYFKSNKKVKNLRKKMVQNKDYDIFCYINKKKQIALAKNNQIGFLKNFNMPKIKESNNSIRIQNWKFLKSYKNSISNLRLNIKIYYKFSNKIPSSYSWYSLEKNKEFVLDKIIREFTKTYKVKNNDITYKNIHRWRYAKVKNYFPLEQSKISKIMPLGIAGDWCPPMLDGDYYVNGQRVEDAFLSGIECSKTLINKYFK